MKKVEVRNKTEYSLSEDGRLWRKEGNKPRCLCIPAIWGRYMAYQRHESNHFGQKRSVQFLRDRVYWKTLTKDVKELVDSCYAWQRRKKPRNMKGQLYTIDAREKFEQVQIDLYSGLPSTRQGYTSIMVITDIVT